MGWKEGAKQTACEFLKTLSMTGSTQHSLSALLGDVADDRFLAAVNALEHPQMLSELVYYDAEQLQDWLITHCGYTASYIKRIQIPLELHCWADVGSDGCATPPGNVSSICLGMVTSF